MYHEYFGLDEPAFSIAVNPRYLYMSGKHKEALAHLLYGIRGGGFVLLSGEVGTGKTTIIRCLLDQLPENTEVAYILNPLANADDMLLTICDELHVSQDSASLAGIKAKMDALQARLLDNHAHGKKTVLLIDEAQLLSADVLEQLRLLTNLETNTEKLLQIILVGQPEVNELLAQPRLRQLSQRITARFHLEPLSLDETQAYIQHRLKIAGARENVQVFNKRIIQRIHQFSGGVPRLVNILCERLLVGAYGHNKYAVDNKIYQLAVKEVQGAKSSLSHSSSVWQRKPFIYASYACALILLLSLLSIELLRDRRATTENSTQTRELTKPASATLRSAELTEPEPESDAQKNASSRTYFKSTQASYAQLFNYYDVKTEEQVHPCWQTEDHKLSCTKQTVESWDELIEINRPLIMTLVSSDKSKLHAVLVGVNEQSVGLLNHKGELAVEDRTKIGEMWTGEILYLWRKPEGYETPIGLGARSPVVTWAAEKFAFLDGQTQRLTKTVLNPALQTRIKIFQAKYGLEPDGILGERTIMKMNEQLGLSKTLMSLEEG